MAPLTTLDEIFQLKLISFDPIHRMKLAPKSSDEVVPQKLLLVAQIPDGAANQGQLDRAISEKVV